VWVHVDFFHCAARVSIELGISLPLHIIRRRGGWVIVAGSAGGGGRLAAYRRSPSGAGFFGVRAIFMRRLNVTRTTYAGFATRARLRARNAAPGVPSCAMPTKKMPRGAFAPAITLFLSKPSRVWQLRCRRSGRKSAFSDLSRRPRSYPLIAASHRRAIHCCS